MKLFRVDSSGRGTSVPRTLSPAFLERLRPVFHTRSLQTSSSTFNMKTTALILLLGLATTGIAQQPAHTPDLQKQHVAMQRLSFLIGSWSGEAHVQRGPNDLVTLAQTEKAYYKLDGLILVLEGTGRTGTEQPPFLQALGIISFDDATDTYRIRAWNNGRFMESEVQLLGDGRSLRWGVGAGETRSTLLQVDKDGQWTEKGELKIGSQEPQKFMDLTVRRK